MANTKSTNNVINNVLTNFKADNSQLVKVFNDSKKMLANLANVGKQTLTKVGSVAGSVFTSVAGKAGTMMSSLSSIGSAVKTVLDDVKTVLAPLLTTGFEFSREMESAKLGISGTLAAMAGMDGEALKFSDALKVADTTMERLRMSAIKTGLEIGELTDTFRELLTEGLDAGLSVGQIEQLSATGLSALKGAGLSAEQATEELKGLLQGEMPSQTIAAVLGLTPEGMQNAKTSADGLFSYLMQSMQGLAVPAEAFYQTWDGQLGLLQLSFATVGEAIVNEFEGIGKGILTTLTSIIAEVDTKTGEIRLKPEILYGIQLVVEAVEGLIGLFGELDAESGKFAANDTVKAVLAELAECFEFCTESIRLFISMAKDVYETGAFQRIIQLLGSVWSIVRDVIEIFRAGIVLLWELAVAFEKAVDPITSFIQKGVVVALGYLKELVSWLRNSVNEMMNFLVQIGVVQERLKSAKEDGLVGNLESREDKTNPDNVTGKNSYSAATSGYSPYSGGGYSYYSGGGSSDNGLQQRLSELEWQLAQINQAYERKISNIELLFEQNALGSADYSLGKLREETKNLLAHIDNYQQQLDEIANVGGSDADSRIRGIKDKMEKAEYRLSEIDAAVGEITADYYPGKIFATRDGLAYSKLKDKEDALKEGRYQQYFDSQKNLINASGATSLVKQGQLNDLEVLAAKRQILKIDEEILAIERQISEARARGTDTEDLEMQLAIKKNAKAAQQEIIKLSDTIAQAELAGRQALENGLVNMLTEGINNARSLGEAFRELATSILEEMQRVFAQAIVQNFMKLFSGKGGNQDNSSNNYGFTYGGVNYDNAWNRGRYATGGLIQGPGTGTSDSIFARLSNGEYVIKAQSVKKWGTGFFDALNSGRLSSIAVNVPKFAQGGYVGNVSKTAASEGLGNLFGNLSTTIPMSIAIVDNKEEAMSKFFTTQKGKKVLLDANKSQSTILKHILKINK